MKLLIKFPTRNRPTKFLKVLETYIRNLDDKETKIIVSCDSDDTTMTDPFIKEVLEQYPNVTLCYGDNNSKIARSGEDVVI